MNETNDVADATQPTREEMIAFLRGHFRYYTMNSWNRSTSYARNVKIYNLGLTRKQESRAYDLIYVEDTFLEINERIRTWKFLGVTGREKPGNLQRSLPRFCSPVRYPCGAR